MSVWAKSWAYDQQCGKVRSEGRHKGRYKGNPTAKAVLVAIAEFANEKGECWASQDTLAGMCDMEARTVRTQLAHLEELGFIERAERRRKDGTRSSDVLVLQAPADRLKPPERRSSKGLSEENEDSQPENFSGSDDQPENGGASTGKLLQDNRKTTTDQPEKFSGLYRDEPSVEPLGEPSEEPVVARETTAELDLASLPDDETSRSLLLLSKVKGFPRDQGENALYLAELRSEFPEVTASEVCKQYALWHRDNPNKTKNHRGRLRNFFKQADKPRAESRASPRASPSSNGNGKAETNSAERRREGYEWLFN